MVFSAYDLTAVVISVFVALWLSETTRGFPSDRIDIFDPANIPDEYLVDPIYCPSIEEIQDPSIPETFTLGQFIGNSPYYELALHDYTQPNSCGCMRSDKTWATNTNKYFNDNFTLVCPWIDGGAQPSNIYPSELTFNYTSTPGYFLGGWPFAADTVFPDTVCAVGEAEEVGAPYRWVIEFQCVPDDDTGYAIFVGINFYSRSNVGEDAAINLQQMIDKGTELGLDKYWNNTKQGLRIVNQTNCYYE